MLYPQLLNGDFEKLPQVLRDFHTTPGGGRASGTAVVRRTTGWLAGLIGFPRSGDDIPLELQVIASDDREIWIRSFDGVPLRTVQRRDGDLMLETAGPIRIAFRLLADTQGMRFESMRARFWIFPLPLRIEAQVWGNDSSWKFRVTVAMVGSYHGEMIPKA